MFCDELVITAISGKGGDGAVSYRREKYIPKGGPDGGDGGQGGSVFLELNTNLSTLYHLKHKHFFKAHDGNRGEDNDKHGKNGEDISVQVPEGTLVYDADTNELLHDISVDTPKYLIAPGGRGGYGNAHFTSSTRQAPDFAELGDTSTEKKLRLELKLVADIGIIGLPSRGKSTLISVISAAKPKIAAYDFTTLVPNLGVVSHRDTNFVVCDIPGLIEGASEGKGLGHEFLRHVERTRMLIHLLDAGRLDHIVTDMQTINNELAKYSEKLAKLPQTIVINKSDLIDKDLESEITLLFKREKIKAPIFYISAATHEGIQVLLDHLLVFLKTHPKEITSGPTLEDVIILRPLEEDDSWKISKDETGRTQITGDRIEQIARMTDMSKTGSTNRVLDILQKRGIMQRLKKLGFQDGDPISIAGKTFYYEEEI